MIFDGRKYVGSASSFINKDKDGRILLYIATAAHNFLKRNGQGGYIEATDVIFNERKNGNLSYRSYKVVKFLCHPKYNGKPTCGYDYAIGILDLSSELKKNISFAHYSKETVQNTISKSFDPETAKLAIGSQVLVNGYPGEKGGYAYKGSGKIIEFCETPSGGLIAYYTAVATPGNSGSPVLIDNPEMLKIALDAWAARQDANAKAQAERGFKDAQYVDCGIHTGFCADKQLNVCTFQTPELTYWRKIILRGPECKDFYK